MAADPSTGAAPSAPATVPRQNNRRIHHRPDRNRNLEVLAVVAIYIAVVHYALKFASFLLPEPEAAPTREEMLRLRGAAGVRGVLGFCVGRTLPVQSGRAANLLGQTHLVSTCHGGRLFGADAQVEATEEAAEANDGLKETTNDNSQAAPTKHKRPRVPVLSYKDNYVVVSKPSGMTMHHNHHSIRTRGRIPILQTSIKKQMGRKPFLVHRLDHRTSGAVMLAFDSETAGELHGRLRDERSVKLYLALVRGDLREKFQVAGSSGGENGVDLSPNGDGSVIGNCDMSPAILGAEERGEGGQTLSTTSNSDFPEYRGKITVDMPLRVDDVEEKEALTEFFFLASSPLPAVDDHEEGTPYTTKSLTLLLCRPRTGRTHQIRRHARKGLGAPIIGDTEHGDSRVNRFWRNEVGLDRLGLHCWHLSLPPDDDGGDADEWIRCMAPLPENFAGPLRHERVRQLWEEAISREPQLGLEPFDERGGTFGRNYRKRIVNEESD